MPIFFVVHISIDSPEPYNTSILQTDTEDSAVMGWALQNPINENGLCFHFSWF